jgi:hypothetical protein
MALGRGLAPLLAGALLLPACSSSTPTISDVTRSALQISVDPNPVPATQDLTGTNTVSYKVTITETAGLGGEMTFVSSSVFDPETGTQVALSYFDSADLLVFVGSGRLEPLGSLVVPQTASYLLPDLRKAATLTVSVQLKDDRENVVNASLLVKIE